MSGGLAYVLDFCFGVSVWGVMFGAYLRGASAQGGFGPGCTCDSTCDRGFLSWAFTPKAFIHHSYSFIRGCHTQPTSVWGLCKGASDRGLMFGGL